MGIANLTKHLLPYADSVVLGDTAAAGADGVSILDESARVRSVVIDGPSLVYHVYYRLLASMSPAHDVLDVQPTCDEISCAVVTCLSELTRRGIQIHKICFDGALPVFKRATRLSRIEKSRQKLEAYRRRAPTSSREWREQVSLPPHQLWQGRTLPARWKNLPENPFMVSAVFEDLRTRWDRAQIAQYTRCNADDLPGGDYPWADLTVMVSGEADIECANVSKITGAAILTNDSDLIVHDLGSDGSVVFLHSVHLIDEDGTESQLQSRSDLSQSYKTRISAMRLHPTDLARRLGIHDIQLFAFHLNEDPHLGFAELVRRSNQRERLESPSYTDFMREYEQVAECSASAVHLLALGDLDPRISELVWQYQRRDVYCNVGNPHIYLGILVEDSSRRCAWGFGTFYRILGYSLLNKAYPSDARFSTVSEFTRRGARVFAEQVTLSSAKTALADLKTFQESLQLARDAFGPNDPSTFWIMFALADIYCDVDNQASLPDAETLERFLTKGFQGQRTEWTDIHLCAQIHAVLYSLRILQQLLRVLPESKYLSEMDRRALEDLPPLHILIPSRQEMLRRFEGKGRARDLIESLFATFG
ncbi:Uncharacterized protein PECH_000574 [Penicillium ucsense]|uniref:Asteroid domain-containing protein n=1 Tax=Penicillium ucsense TaxID=2839758 RepID=A0A8J8W1I1_9EURO|nr:Uncharacterized protein PECM_000947 [Penicillium ucsense]KAF7733473.1 Uncharacterized protein PECH_000574 [Penicillium ucsense]